MATFYAAQFVGVADGTLIPALKADGRQVGAKEAVTIASKVALQAWANGDKIYVGKLRAGEIMRSFSALSDTSFGTTTISVGTLASATKYVNAKTMTTTDVPTALGPLSAAVAAGPLTADEDIYVTLGVGGIAGAVVASFLMASLGVR